MDYWISRNGPKEGPYQEWDIRDFIEAGELSADDLIWCEGQEKWQTLEAIQIFRTAFLKKQPPPTEEPESPKQPPPLPNQAFWVRRAAAKIFDFFLYYIVFFILCNFMGIRFGIDPDLAWLELLKVLPFVAAEAYCTHKFGWSPGKWLLGLRVVSVEGGRLDWKAAWYRSAGVWLFGMAFGILPLFFISMLLSYFMARRRGRASWEIMSGSEVSASSPLNPLRLTGYVLSFLGLLVILTLFVQWHPATAAEYQNQLEGLWQQYPALRPPQS